MRKLIVLAVLAFVSTANAGVVRFSAKHGYKAAKFAGKKSAKGVKFAAKVLY